MNGLAAAWRGLAQRVDALSLRERAMVLAAAAAVLCVGFYLLQWSPLTAREARLAKQAAKAEGDRQALAAQLAELARARAADPDAALRARLAQIGAEMAEIDGFIADRRSQLVPPDRMAGLLRDVLSKRDGVQLLSLKSLAPQPVGAGGAGAGQMFRHGVELVLEGPYLELMGYLEALEHLPWRMFWGRAALDAAAYPKVTLSLTVYTLSTERTWLAV